LFFDLRFFANRPQITQIGVNLVKRNLQFPGEHRPLGSSRQLAEMPHVLSANKLYVHVSGKLPETTGSPRRIRPVADWQPVLPRI
jgi:hypothetical protein